MAESESEQEVPLNDLNDGQVSRAPTTSRTLSREDENYSFRKLISSYAFALVAAVGAIIGCMILGLYLFVFKSPSVDTCESSDCFAKAEYVIGSPTCRTEACNSTATFIIDSINRTVNPCDNFYNFICGNGTVDKYQSFNAFEKLTSIIDEIPNNSTKYIKKFKKFHQSCVDYKGKDDDIRKIVEKIYDWPILNKDKTKKNINFDWTSNSHKLFKSGYRADYLITVLLDVETGNYSKKILRLTQPNFSTHKQILQMELDSDYMKDYKETLIKSIRRVGAKGDIEQDINDIMNFERSLANISHIETYNTTTIKDLETMFPKFKWLDYINGIFSPHAKLNASERIYVADPFVRNFYNLMTDPSTKPTNRTLANYALWRVLRSIEQMEPDESHYNETEHQRKMDCTSVIYASYMYHAASALYIKNNKVDNSIEAAMKMTLNMRQTYINMIKKNNWLSKEMKDKIEKKILNMDLLLGYPKELLNDTILEDFYSVLNIPSDNFIVNGLNYRMFELRKKGENLREAYNKTHWTGYYAHILENNARYGVQNSIHVPVDLIQPLLADLSVPSYMNYALMGFTIAHEMFHALAVQSLNYDENGNLNEDWWDDKNLKKYVKKMDCIIDKYNNYTHHTYDDLKVDGKRTFDENMSDISGLKVAYDAYLKYIEEKPHEALLPGLENYTPLQMFWMVFGSTWCSDENYDTLVLQFEQNVHAPERFRVNGVVSSIKEFSEDFSCLPTDAMNPNNKCPMWF